ncbi:sulfurtransferase complex subunit TusC [Frischella sp. Ac48]|uniref:Sulfurtransferase complex subunit TusC n=1 Tax=Frischella japonica TaxID=2741544 RepID=A0ABR7R012_9GAMM|nr:sulfurtransferase complex subunit TusC [Frischella japonica]MBX4132662.1 sulfurtransferase complex subunit TusC [Frischella sp. Ac48]
MKQVAIIFSHPPYGTSNGREALDLALSLSDINTISVFFIHYGIFHLLTDQQPDKILMRDYISTLAMLELYDVTNIYASTDSMTELNLTITQSVINFQAITNTEIANLLAKHDVIINM